MKTIEIEDDLYHYIAAQTRQIGESASDILRRLLLGEQPVTQPSVVSSISQAAELTNTSNPPLPESINPAAQQNSSPGTVFDLVSRQDLQAESSVVGRFLYLLSVLARVHKNEFSKVLDIKGRNRLYFATSAEALSEAGSSTNPKQIPNTGFWVITNSNTTRKKMMLTETAVKLGYSEQDAERIRDLL